jgi:hypothetical protein
MNVDSMFDSGIVIADFLSGPVGVSIQYIMDPMYDAQTTQSPQIQYSNPTVTIGNDVNVKRRKITKPEGKGYVTEIEQPFNLDGLQGFTVPGTNIIGINKNSTYPANLTQDERDLHTRLHEGNHERFKYMLSVSRNDDDFIQRYDLGSLVEEYGNRLVTDCYFFDMTKKPIKTAQDYHNGLESGLAVNNNPIVAKKVVDRIGKVASGKAKKVLDLRLNLEQDYKEELQKIRGKTRQYIV